MALLTTYAPEATRIIHSTGIDFNARPSIFKPVHLVQYDNKLPILAVSLYNNGQEYVAPTTASANIRLGKKDRKFVSNPALGCSQDRKILYFEITQQMVTDWGKYYPIVEIIVNGLIAGSSPICMIVEKNPIQEGDIESSDEFKTLDDYVSQAEAAKDTAAAKAKEASDSASKAAGSAYSAQHDASAALEMKDLAERAAESASASEESAKDWSNWSKSYAVGEGGKRDNEETDNAKAYYEGAQKALEQIEQQFNGIIPMGSITFAELKNAEKKIGYMYNITDSFISDDTFNSPGKEFGPGNNVVWTAEEKWDVFASSSVSGIRGNAETSYHQGYYEITPDKVKLPSTFEMAVERARIAPNDTLSVAFSKLAKYCETIEQVEVKTPVFGTYESFPRPGDTGRLYVDDSQDPRLIFTWDQELEEYVMTGGAGGEDGGSIDIPVTLLSGSWVKSGDLFTQTVTVSQMREGLTPIHFLADQASDDEQYAYSLLIDYTTALGSITFYASERPETDIHLVLKGVPKQELEIPDNNVLVLVDHTTFSQNEETTYYESTIVVDGMKEGIGGHWDIVRSGGIITQAESELALNILSVERLQDAIKVTCINAPSSDFKLLLFGTYKEATEGDTLISGLSGLFGRVSANETAIQGLGTKVSSAETTIRSLETSVSNNTSSIATLKEESVKKLTGNITILLNDTLTCGTEYTVKEKVTNFKLFQGAIKWNTSYVTRSGWLNETYTSIHLGSILVDNNVEQIVIRGATFLVRNSDATKVTLRDVCTITIDKNRAIWYDKLTAGQSAEGMALYGIC